MNVISCLYKDYSEFKSFLVACRFDARSHCLVVVKASGYSQEQCVEVARQIRSILPNAIIKGVSSKSIGFDGKIRTDCIHIEILSFRSTRLKSLIVSLNNGHPADWALEIVGNICSSDTRLVTVNFSTTTNVAEDFVREFNKLLPEIPMFGGNCSTQEEPTRGFIFDDQQSYRDSLFVLSFSGDNLIVTTGMVNNVESIGDVYTITSTDGIAIDEFDGHEAKEFLAEVLGFEINNRIPDEQLEELNKTLLKFPFVSVDSGEAIKFIEYNKQIDKICVLPYGKFYEGERIRLGYLSVRAGYSDYSQLFDEFDMQPMEHLIVLSCFVRPLLFPNLHSQCLQAIKPKNCSVSYQCGEIARSNHQNGVFQGTTIFLGLSEDPDHKMSSFDRSKLKIDEATEDAATVDIYNDVLKRQTDYVFAAKEELLRLISEQEKLANKSLFIEKNTNMFNVEKFSYDSISKNINKICLVVIEKSAQLANYIGHDDYIEYFKLNLSLFTGYLKERELLDETTESFFEKIRIYVNDLSSFIIAAPRSFNSDRFLEIIRGLFLCFNKHYNYKNMVCLNNFFIVLDQDEELLEKAKLMLSEKKNELKRFVLFEESKQESENFEESLLALATINYAIEHDGIEPYFQPIYDNSSFCTHKFESLMRIKDANGKLWFPNQFLPVAKEFRLYLQLSCAMINKVFDLFENRDESVSINLSAIDINSELVTSMIYDRLSGMKNPEHFIFEILESDAFDDLNTLSNFINNLRKYHVLIAIDDFGSGYSNLIEIVKLRPDLIKIDGEIIKHLLNDEVNRHMIDVIIYMARTFNVDLVAEYAESKELQDFLAEKGIRYSQGYYFSKPLPYSQIDAYLDSERSARATYIESRKREKPPV